MSSILTWPKPELNEPSKILNIRDYCRKTRVTLGNGTIIRPKLSTARVVVENAMSATKDLGLAICVGDYTAVGPTEVQNDIIEAAAALFNGHEYNGNVAVVDADKLSKLQTLLRNSGRDV